MPPVPQCKYMLTKYQTDLSSVVAPSTSPDYAHLTTIPDPVPLQQLTAGFGKASCRALGLQSGTWQSRYTQLYVGFAVSGLLHCGGDLLVDPSHKLFGASFPFFFSQAVAITFEDAVIALVRRSGVKVPQVLARAVGYAWAVAWLCLSAPWLINWTLRAGIIDMNRIPISLVDRVAPSLGTSVARLAAVIPAMGMKA